MSEEFIEDTSVDNQFTDTHSVDDSPSSSARMRDTTQERERKPYDPGEHRANIRDTIRESVAEATEAAEAREAEETPQEAPQEAKPKRERTRLEDGDHQGASGQEPAQQEALAAPTSWTREAKEAWNTLPDRVKQEVIKREADMQRGVDQFKAQVAQQYGELDQALAPYQEVIRHFNKTPGQAVNQLFAWHDAFTRDPDRAFPAVMQSYGFDPARLFAAYGIDPNAFRQFMYQYQQQNPQYQQNVVTQQWQEQQNRIAALERADIQRNQAYQQAMWNQQVEATNAYLQNWSKDKPYFPQVQVMMGHLLTPDPQTGIAAVPLRADGTVDLDLAYDMAIHGMPEIRAQREAEAQAKRQKAEMDRRRRNAGGSIAPGAPFGTVNRGSGPQKGLSVRDSIRQAIVEHSN